MKEEYVLKNVLSNRLGSFENKTQLKEEIACEKLAFAGMEIDASKRLVYRGEKEVNITFTEFEILHLLARNPGRVFSKEQIYNSVWKETYFGDYCNLLEYLTQRDIQTKNSGVNVRYRGKHRFFKGFNEFIKEKTRRCDNDFEKIERHVFF